MFLFLAVGLIDCASPSEQTIRNILPMSPPLEDHYTFSVFEALSFSHNFFGVLNSESRVEIAIRF
jgi:hypothetical protein